MRFGAKVDSSLLEADFLKGVPIEEVDLGKLMSDAVKGMGEGGAKQP